MSTREWTLRPFRVKIVGFRDNVPRSVTYRIFENEAKAVVFYLQQLRDPAVRVISTRKIKRGE